MNTTMDLCGKWRIALDPDDLGLQQEWFLRELPGEEHMDLPGSIQEAGFGEEPSLETHWTGAIVDKALFSNPRYAPYRDPENFKMPCWLLPRKVYQGACWFQRTVRLEEAGDWMELFMERCHWFSRVWLGDRELGRGDSLGAPHVFRFKNDTAGETLLTLCIDNRLHIDVGPNSHSVSDHTQGNWNGVAGGITLKKVPPLRLERVEIDADPGTGRVRVDLEIQDDDPGNEEIHLQLRVLSPVGTPLAECVRSLIPGSESRNVQEQMDLELPVETWSPQAPNLYHLELMLRRGGETLLCHREDVGFVHMETRGREILLNGTPIKLRGTLDCAVFPGHGYPPADVPTWERILRRIQEYGLNHVRFHSWCPPEAAFVAGDRVGMIFQIECGSWANTTTALGKGEPIDDWLYEEGGRIVRAYGNHPCFRLMAYGNEPAGPGGEPGADYLNRWLSHWKKRDPRRLHTGGAGWPRIPENDFHNLPQPRLQAWGAGLDGWLNAQAPGTAFDLEPILEPLADRPVVSHEIGQWCVYPDMDEIDTYTGFMRAGNLEIYRDFLDQAGLLPMAKAYHLASGKLQTLCYKFEIEAALRSRSLAGFQLLGLQDFPGQGTAPVGALDAFWEPKSYVDAAEYREFCGDTVLLAAMDRMVFQEGDSLEAELLCSHFGAQDLTDTDIAWTLEDGTGRKVAGAVVPASRIATGGLRSLCRIQHIFADLGRARRLELCLEISGTEIRNRWNLFVYPRSLPLPDLSGIRVMDGWSPALAAALERGESVWLRLKPKDIATRIQTGFSSIFWNTAWTRGQAPHTMGLICDPAHPALAAFPTASHSDVQWWSILRHAAPMEVDRLGWTDGGIVSLVPDWNDPKPMSIAFEASAGRGRVLVTSVDFEASDDPALHQFESSLLRYWHSAPPPERRSTTPGRLLTLLK